MFQTEPIIYLQSLGNEWFTLLMILITKMGSSAFLAAAVICITFGISFRKGFLLFQLLIWTGLITEILKTIVAFPRPDFVDNRVINLESGVKSTSPFSGDGPDGVFALPDKEVLEAFRHDESLTHSCFGFPSGHASLTTALWGGSYAIFCSRIIKIMTPIMVLLVAFSRMYLGRHFLGDVLGGTTLGLILLTAFILFLKSPLKDEFFRKENFELAFRWQNIIFYFVILVLLPALAALSLVSAKAAGFFLGTNVAYILIIRKGLPDDTGSAEQRVLRVFIALLLFGVSCFVLAVGFDAIEAASFLSFKLIEFLEAFVPASTIWISTVACIKLNLYRREIAGAQESELDRKSLEKSG